MADELVTLEILAGTLPDPVEFRRRALQAARAGYERAIDGQQVHTPEDTFAVQRELARTRELAKQYASTFSAVDKELANFQRDQLERLPAGVQTSVHVPDAEGDLTVQLDQANSYSFDEGQLLTAVAAHVCGSGAIDALIEIVENAQTRKDQFSAVGDAVAMMLVAGLKRVAAMGQLGLQVTKVRAFADELARDGQLGLSGVVRDAIIKSTKTKPGAKFTRKEAK